MKKFFKLSILFTLIFFGCLGINSKIYASEKNIKVKLDSYSYTYSGKAIKPKVNQILYNGAVTINKKDYKVSYKRNYNAGKGLVVVKINSRYYKRRSHRRIYYS